MMGVGNGNGEKKVQRIKMEPFYINMLLFKRMLRCGFKLLILPYCDGIAAESSCINVSQSKGPLSLLLKILGSQHSRFKNQN